jgi:hypothetical protein
LVLDDPVSGALQVEYRSEMFAAPITLALGLQILQESVSLKNVVLALNSQRIDGNGCVRFDEPAGLHLDLVAEDLDLGALSPIIPEGESGESDLSFVHAIKLRVHTAQMAGALAEDVLVQAGSEPECASAPEALP